MYCARVIRLSNAAKGLSIQPTRLFTLTPFRQAEGDTGSHRGQQGGDAFTRREKAAEDMYIKEREKEIVVLLREKIVKQQEQLAKDMAMLAAMEDQYGEDQMGRGGER